MNYFPWYFNISIVIIKKVNSVFVEQWFANDLFLCLNPVVLLQNVLELEIYEQSKCIS